MGSQAISIQLRKILYENLAGNCCGKILQEIVVGKSCRKLLWENLVGNSCRKLLQENLAGNCCGKIFWKNLVGNSCMKWRRGKSQFKKGSDWWKFSIWNRVMGSQPISIQLRKILRKNLVGNCCRKMLQEILVGNCCGKFLWENLVGKSYGNFLMGSQPISIQFGKILRENLAEKC